MESNWTILSLINWSCEYLTRNSIDNPKLESEILLAESLGVKRLDLYLNFDKPLGQPELAKFKEVIKKRLRHIPYQYIFNKAYFREFVLYVDANVLIPRPETELLVDKVIQIAQELLSAGKQFPIIDIGSGSGCISISLASKFPELNIVAIDKSPAALEITRKNAAKYNLSNIEFVNADIADFDFNCLKSELLIVSNPPYILTAEMSTLQAEVKCEPELALDGGIDGLDCYRTMFDRIIEYTDNINFCFELGYNQKSIMTELLHIKGIDKFTFFQDYENIDRIVCGIIPGRTEK